MKNNSILFGAAILTITGLITKILGFVYRVYMSNVLGSEGMGLYALITPIYMLCWAISASGFTTTVSRLIAAQNAKKEYGNIKRILFLCIITSFIIALILSITVFNFSNKIAQYFLNDKRCILSLKILSSCFVFMSTASCIRGYFFSMNKTIIPATSQVFEQVVRMGVIFFFAEKFVLISLEYACAIAVIGMCLGEIMSFFYVYIFFRFDRKKEKTNKKPSLSYIKAYKMILLMAIPLTLNRVTGSALSTVENILIPISLQKYGMSSKEALSCFGNLTAMAMPLIMFGSSFLTSVSVCIVPAISSSIAIGDKKRVKNIASKSIFFTILIAFLTAGIFVTFSYETGYLIYREDMERTLFLMGLISPLIYLQVIFSGLLNGLGEQIFIFRNSILSSLITISFIYFLMPIYSIDAFILGSFISLFVTCLLEITRIYKRTVVKIEFTDKVLKPLLSIVLSCLSARLVNNFLTVRFGVYSVIISVIYLTVLYILLLNVTGCIDRGEIKKYIKSIIK